MPKYALPLLAVLFTAGLLAAVASAGGHHGLQVCVPKRGVKSHCKTPPSPTTMPGTTTAPPTTTTPPPTTTAPEPPIPAPPVNRSLPVEGFCVQTVERGNTFVQASPDSFKPGGDWYALWTGNAQVILDGHVVTLQYEGGAGAILAANVPGVGLTCDQPYVTTDLKYADPSYGLR